MNTFLRSEAFDAWLSALKDKVGRARIIHRIRSAEHGNFGDCEPVGEGISEMRIHTGPGYRVYYTRRGEVGLSAPAGRRQGLAEARHQTRH
jgi:putative addiction module killer protein